MPEKVLSGRTQHHVVDVEKIRHGRATAKHEQRRIGARCDKADDVEETYDPCEQGPRCLPKTIQGLGEEADCIRLCRVDEADGLLEQHAFVEAWP